MTEYPSAEHPSGIKAKVIAHSTSNETQLVTFELEYPRFIHSEFMTHRMLSKNSASSRAIPIATMHDHILRNPQRPVHWGKNQPGMSAKEEVGASTRDAAILVWDAAMTQAISHARVLSDMGLHKQVANRLTEPFMQMKVVCSGTEWANFFHLRNHEDADPTIHALAKTMWEALDQSLPLYLNPGEWHLPYIDVKPEENQSVRYYVNEQEIDLETAKMISASCCAQVSYRKEDTSVDKAKMIFDKLINSKPVHASPVEHQATPMDADIICPFIPETWQEGITHVSANGDMWSGNFRSWIQHRQLIKDHVVW